MISDKNVLQESGSAPFQIDQRTTVGAATLAVADLEMMTDFYTRLIGLKVLDRSSSVVKLGVGDKHLLQLEQRPNGRSYPNATGLYHLAFLLPSRSELGQWLGHLTSNNYRLSGASDHLVSEALYLDDPEGNGIEVYRDRPRVEWGYENDMIKMATIRLDLQALLADAKQEPFDGLASGSTMGHIHLQVDDVERNVEFYNRLLGFDVMLQWQEASFLSAGGYHHHLGMNVWHSRGAQPAPEGSLGLISYEVIMPDASTREAMLTRFDQLNVPIEQISQNPSVIDPSGNWVVLTL